MNTDVVRGLRGYWHPVCAESDLEDGRLLPATLLDEDIVVYRVGDDVLAVQDLCIHRGTRLSLGTLRDDGCLVCPYHGWEYDVTGRCVRIPSLPEKNQHIPSRARVAAYATARRSGLVFVAHRPVTSSLRAPRPSRLA